MEKIPTSEELYIQLGFMPSHHTLGYDIKTAMVEFARLHVKAALKEASEKARLKELEIHLSDGSVDKDSILNSYPLENIK